MECLADRFLFDNGRWIDAATGNRVQIHLEEASALDAFDWDEQCGRLFNARHPLLNPLLDYGAAPDGRRFEAYACSGPACHSGPVAERRLLNLVGFLRTTGIPLTGSRSRLAVRQTAAGEEPTARPIGITLQPRRALDAVRETLESPAAAPSLVVVVATPMSGLRTAQLLVARTAIERVIGDASRSEPLDRRLKELEAHVDAPNINDDLRRSLNSQLDILRQRIAQQADVKEKIKFLDAEIVRIQEQAELIREQAALSTDPERLSERIDQIAATLGGTSQWIRDQQQVYGEMEDLLTEPPRLGSSMRIRESK